ncbi:alpha/beta hydrolase [Dankookia rubra]|uniref:alpha/beta hydrolase n=1 Tax=Dankookia rubra TaxID=1442381 RepID=UPI0014097EB3|nr:alpha/beta hydrolase [Dankookia rubra]
MPVPTLAWEACPPAPAGSAPTDAFLCATAVVPMDHAKPGHGIFSLAVIRHPARDGARRLGTLFWNPGGPSDAGTQYLPAAIGGFPERVRDRFDIISWDPRGMGGRTTPVVQCFDSAEAEAAFLDARLQSLAVTPEELAADAAARTALNAACIARNGDLLAHVSTADNARDLDLLRQAVGEERMNYYGTSYGTFLGATYANLFPDRLRAMVLDGAVAPAAWAGDAGEDLSLSTFIRLGSDRGSRATVRAFLDECGRVDATACAFSAGSPEATRRKWRDLLERARSGLVVEGQPIDDRDITVYVQSSIYLIDPLPGFGRFPGWAAVADFLQKAAEAGEAATAAAAAPPTAAAAGAAAPGVYVTSAGRQLSVICGESPNPMTEEAASEQALRSYARAGISAWPFVAYCVGWTARAADPYLGPWDRRTAAPVLVVGNTFDPATAYASSVRMARELARGRLLTVDGFGHTELLNPSRCAQAFIADYIIDGTLPPRGTRCDQDNRPFPAR